MNERTITSEVVELTIEQRDLLVWLGKEDFSQYGECHGKALDRLVELGLAQVHDAGKHQSGFIAPGGTGMHRAVSLTDKGRDTCRAFEQTESMFEAGCVMMQQPDGRFAIQIEFVNIKTQEFAQAIADAMKDFVADHVSVLALKHSGEEVPPTNTVQ